MRMEMEDNISLRRPRREKFLIISTAFLALTTITFLALFAVYYTKADDSDNDNNNNNNNNNISSVCKSKICVNTAAQMASKMDMTADPCQDFAQYACGGFYKNAVIRSFGTTSAFEQVAYKTSLVLRDILKEAVKPEDKSYIRKMKTIYQNLMDVDTMEKVRLAPYISSPMAKEWPTLNPAWNPSNFSLNDVIEMYAREFVTPLVNFLVGADANDSDKNILTVTRPISPFLKMVISIRSSPRNSPLFKAIEEYYVILSTALGANATTAKKDAKDEINFQLALISIFDRKSGRTSYQSTLSEMSQDFSPIDFHRAIQAVYDSFNITIPVNQTVIDRFPHYFGKLPRLLFVTDKRIIKNHFGFYHAMEYGVIPPSMINSLKLAMAKMLGLGKFPPIWKSSVSELEDIMPYAIGKVFIASSFTDDTKQYMKAMVEDIHNGFAGILKEIKWMEPETKKAALAKLNHMLRKVGYPDEKFTDQDLDKMYEKLKVYPGEPAKQKREIKRFKMMKEFEGLNEPVDKKIWEMPITDTNALYRDHRNEITIPAGILQPPFFLEQAPSSVNYGAIGSIIGHEITHGFDPNGSQYDYKGNLKNWWQAGDLQEYKEKIKCVIDQYSNFTVEEIKTRVPGGDTVNENTADIGGLKDSYRAYQLHSTSSPTELPLPDLGLTNAQQFFLAFAQMYCEKTTASTLKNSIRSDEHSPDRFRIKGTLQDNDDFARAYNCPVGSPMNPAKKCVVW